MEHRDYRDIFSGLALVIIGLAFAWYATDYRLGTVARVGPGFPPLVVGLIVAGLGAVIAVAGARRWVEPGERFALRPFIAIIGAIALFAATVRTLGLVPATVLLVAAATFATGRFQPRYVALLAAALTGLAYVIFIAILGLPIMVFSDRLLEAVGMR